MPPKRRTRDVLEKLQGELRRVQEAQVQQAQRTRHLRLDVERLGTVLERRTRERDICYAELETLLDTRPAKLKVLEASRKAHAKTAKRLTREARDEAASQAEVASAPEATQLWEARVAGAEYALETARLKPLAARLARLDAAMADCADEARRDAYGAERGAILARMRCGDFAALMGDVTS